MILVDTSVWIEFIRHPDSTEARQVRQFLRENQVASAGVIMAEVLQGARSRRELEDLRIDFLDLPFLEATPRVWAEAGELSFQLRQQGMGIPLIDCLIATLALRADHSIYTLDQHFQRIPGLKLHRAGVQPHGDNN